MKFSTRSLVFIALAAMIQAASADITSLSVSSQADNYQYNNSAGYMHYASAVGPPISFVDPFSSSTAFLGTDYAASAASYSDNVTVNTPNYAQIDASFYGMAQADTLYGFYNTIAYVDGYDYVTFTLDQPGTVTMKISGTNSFANGQTHFEQSYAYIDSNLLQSGVGDGTYVVPVGVGIHYCLFEGVVETYVGSYGAYGYDAYSMMSANYQMTISSAVPEPCTLSFLGVAGLLALKRRRKA